jgi:Holliday junction resolvase RusA-like endonuclease
MIRPPRILLHVIIPGQPHVQQRHRWGRGRIYDPSSDDKISFQWQLRAACPTLKPELEARIGVRLTVWTSKRSQLEKQIENEDADNFLKFYMDAMSPPKTKHKQRPVDVSRAFAVWGNDNQVDEVHARIWRGATEPRVEILVYVLSAD